MTTIVETRSTCRVCDGPLVPILSLGEQRIAGGFGTGAPARKVPLELVRCDTSKQGACGLVQLAHTVPPPVLYSSYFYRSGVNDAMVEHLHGIAEQADLMCPRQGSVVDVGCNDGTLLDGYRKQDRGGPLVRLGFEPSDIGEQAKDKGHQVIRDYFSARALERHALLTERHNVISGIAAITSIAMFYDLDDPHEFVDDVAAVLHPSGVWILELHYLPTMLESGGFDAICHEHLCYYSLAVLERLLAEHDLEVIDAELNAVNGGSIRVFARHAGAAPIEPAAARRLRKLRLAEFEAELDTPRPYAEFAARARQTRGELRRLCTDLARAGKRIHVYGASTKGNTLLQFCGLGPELIEYAADRDQRKWGTHTATGIPIGPESESRAMEPDYYLVLPWHFLDGFIDREHAFLERGGRFIVPAPDVRTIGLADVLATPT